MIETFAYRIHTIRSSIRTYYVVDLLCSILECGVFIEVKSKHTNLDLTEENTSGPMKGNACGIVQFPLLPHVVRGTDIRHN